MTAIWRAPWPIVVAVGLHLVVAIACAAALALVDGAPAKPLKFALSIALLLGTLGWVLAVLDVPGGAKLAFAWVIAVAMVVEMAAIGIQAARGVPSHFNTRTPFDAAMWAAMLGAIVVAVVAFVALAVYATVAAWRVDPLIALAGRAALWILLLAAVSGFAMGGRLSHSVGAHGDLRAPHFFAIHGLQVLPVAAWAIGRLDLGDGWSRGLVIGAIALWVALAVLALVQAFAGRALVR